MESIHFETDECGQLAEWAARSGWEMQCVQTEPGPFRGVCHIAKSDLLRVCLGTFSPALRIQGRVPDGWRAITMADAGAAFRGQTLGNGSLCFIVPGDPAFWQTPADHATDTVMVEASALDHAMHSISGKSLEEAMPHTVALDIPPECLAPLRRLLRALVSEATSPSESSEILSSALVRCIAVILCGPAARHRMPAHPNPEAGHVAVAFSLIEENVHRSVPLRELCEHSEVCPRTLQTSFVHQTGVSPTRFARELRLNRVRYRLRGARSSSSSVKEIALEHGFRHLGHFSHDYAALFGELPSQTLGKE